MGSDEIKTVAVVGVGYVGLTLLCALARAGYAAIAYDIDAVKIAEIAKGRVPFAGAEPELHQLLADGVRGGRVTATTDPAALSRAQAVFVAVETPVDADDHCPKYVALHSALETITPHLSPGTLVVIESTVAPGTMRTLVQPVLRQHFAGDPGDAFYLVHCPERVMPGKLLHNISTCDRIVGGVSPACTARAVSVYARVTSGKLHPTDALTAEIVKTAENAYRDVQIAFANEMAYICEELGADVYAVRELVNSSPFRQMHVPGAGVGGHCIPKDPWLLCSALAEYTPSLLPAARAINDGMPTHLVRLLQHAMADEGIPLADARVAVLGASYLADTDDTRNTPTLPLLRELRSMGAAVVVVDPYVSSLEEFAVTAEISQLRDIDAMVMVTAHQAFSATSIVEYAGVMRGRIFIDGRNVLTAAQADQAGLRYYGVGKPHPITVAA